ncbi:TPA: hypothetical protein IUX11_002141 [Enterococcus faecalis]|uniref:hypothetical protein n=2 Tax=Enterococcus faecalis TaxID=1351 RepID=UPI0017848A31|nr:hypothetical protein [Enterococcus faecalis]MBD9871177.1 hypothetical protein [Enterococcus faecalis]HAP4755513.1 hypothetical protein [Enterococcus faecalis]
MGILYIAVPLVVLGCLFLLFSNDAKEENISGKDIGIGLTLLGIAFLFVNYQIYWQEIKLIINWS